MRVAIMPISKDELVDLLPIKDYRPGQQLKIDLGLANFQNVVIQKAINFPIPLYVVTYNSRYPERAIFYSKVKSIKTSFLAKLRQYGNQSKFKTIKLTPPVDLNYFNKTLRTNCYVYCRDMCGEQFRDKNMFQVMNESLVIVEEDFENCCLFTGRIFEGIIRPNSYIEEMLNSLKSNVGFLASVDKQHLSFFLNSLFYIKYKIHFNNDTDSSRGVPISKAAHNYRTNIIEVNITDILLNNLQDEKILNHFVEQFEIIVGHEILHRLQYGKNKIKNFMNKYNVEDVNDLNQVRRYLSDKEEIMAYAWQIVEFFKIHDYKREKIKNLLKNNELENEKYQYEPLYYYHKVFKINDAPLRLLYKYMYMYLDSKE